MTRDYEYLSVFCKDFCDIIHKYTKYIVVSGFFVISSGRSRATEDIDIIIEPVTLETFIPLHEELAKKGYQCFQSPNPKKIYNDYLKENIAVRYIKNEELIPSIEFKFARDELDEYQIKNRKKFDLTDVDVYFSNVEANIAFKEELLKSPKDLADARHLRIVYSEIIDEKEIDHIKEMIKKYRLR